MIEVRNVTKKYDGIPVVNNVSIEIPKGKITSFIGPNGAGKSTLLSIISRLIKKDSGEVYIDNKELSTWDSKTLAKKISILKQSNHINLRLSVRDLVTFGRFPYSQGKLTEEDWYYVDQAISYMQLEDIQNKNLHQLSGGQCQRAFIAMILAQNTEYCLLDEPLNNLDMQHAVDIMKVLRSMSEDLGKTIVIVIHDINFASCYSDHIVAMKNGVVVNQGSSDEIIDQGVLGGIYNLDFHIEEVRDNKICVYY